MIEGSRIVHYFSEPQGLECSNCGLMGYTESMSGASYMIDMVYYEEPISTFSETTLVAGEEGRAAVEVAW
jgi:hypothetical protein